MPNPYKGAKPGTPEFGKSIGVEEKAGYPPKQAQAIAYSEARRAKHDGELIGRGYSAKTGKQK